MSEFANDILSNYGESFLCTLLSSQPNNKREQQRVRELLQEWNRDTTPQARVVVATLKMRKVCEVTIFKYTNVYKSIIRHSLYTY